jgi:hypothetical protein
MANARPPAFQRRLCNFATRFPLIGSFLGETQGTQAHYFRSYGLLFILVRQPYINMYMFCHLVSLPC